MERWASNIVQLRGADPRSRLLLTARNRPDDEKGLLARGDRVGQWGIGRFMGEIFLACKEPQEWPALLCDVIADGPPQHGIAGLERVEYRALRDRTFDLNLHFAAGVRQRPQMLRQREPDRTGSHRKKPFLQETP